jgi:hypothetical protein
VDAVGLNEPVTFIYFIKRTVSMSGLDQIFPAIGQWLKEWQALVPFFLLLIPRRAISLSLGVVLARLADQNPRC